MSLRDAEIEWDEIKVTVHGLSICSSRFVYLSLYPQNDTLKVFESSASKKWLVHPIVHS